ncbi:MAG TPA: TetR/AcrR family transcriptional regulator [Usitatibacter sp.]|nr:TetR/AcrR family transcriptional regulator [Usitatibacter sp.]
MSAIADPSENNVNKEAQDKRVQKTRQALLGAFFGLVLERRYEEIKVSDILERAGVGKSTFYEHFSGKDGILGSSLQGPFEVLADAMRRADNTAQLVTLLEHFWANRAMARGIFQGAVRRKTTAVLIALIEQRLKVDGVDKPVCLIIPRRLAAIQLAEGLLAPTTAWLTGEEQCPVESLALALRRTATATLSGLSRPR